MKWQCSCFFVLQLQRYSRIYKSTCLFLQGCAQVFVSRNDICSFTTTPALPTTCYDQAFTSGTVDDFGNGSYRVWMMPTVAGPYDISVAIDGQARQFCHFLFPPFPRPSLSYPATRLRENFLNSIPLISFGQQKNKL